MLPGVVFFPLLGDGGGGVCVGRRGVGDVGCEEYPLLWTINLCGDPGQLVAMAISLPTIAPALSGHKEQFPEGG